MAPPAKLGRSGCQQRSTMNVTARQCGSMALIYLVMLASVCYLPVMCQSASQQEESVTGIKTEFDSNLNATSSESSTLLPPTSSTTSSVEEDSDYSSETNLTSTETRRRHDAKKVGQIIVYFSVIFIALAGVLIKYFVTQYETSQLKAQEQLNYQRLGHNC